MHGWLRHGGTGLVDSGGREFGSRGGHGVSQVAEVVLLVEGPFFWRQEVVANVDDQCLNHRLMTSEGDSDSHIGKQR